jgi:hypothetical protein
MKSKSANLIIKAGDLSRYITHFIGVMRDEYINFLSHELKETVFNTASKVLEDTFSSYSNELRIMETTRTPINLIKIL